MQVFRLSQSKFSEELSGEGARLFGGRWNSKGIAIIYTAQSRSLALAETIVHLPLKKFTSHTHTLAVITISDQTPIQKVSMNELPQNWNNYPSPVILAEMGDEWIKRGESLVLQVPSSAVIGEFNFLLNPRYQDFKNLKWEIEKFPYDERMFSNIES